ncbi:universal stress protein UspA [Arthrobacter sp. MYb224]|uniref:universal stress protein n=1 Tax=Micrococcaceae TaxID=1268 RepID=UPI000CFD2E3C|nr:MULTISPECIES: universal stress protein [unclassified Arthrobacter]PRA00473.1 universal stress protein UspA [Arthrobacter sp. MYb224]PRA04665.1 universal stress protein UspA [Arthrobacter sp. MYb229]PRB51421.1 universal stress protein UspA [Arthrobacter sp. MYb216]
MSIIVGYVPSNVGEAAVAAAIKESKLRQEELLIVNSSRDGSLVDKNTASPEDLARVLESAAQAGIEARVLESTYRDDLTEEFLGLADEHQVSLIVIGLRQRSQVGKFIMGSQAQRILLQAQHPVLAVKVEQT